MPLNTLTAISPIDGRYHSKADELAPYFSEYGLMKYRVRVEIEYFIALSEAALPQLRKLTDKEAQGLRMIYCAFTEDDAHAIKEYEKSTNHDVKAVEYFIKDKMTALGLEQQLEFIHFGLTSQDINNTAIPLSLKEAIQEVYGPELDKVISFITNLAHQWAHVPMLARTHGQPASPTRLGKELLVFSERLLKQVSQLGDVPYSAKFGGATGNYNAHHVAYPHIDWIKFGDQFVNEKLGLERSRYTTQIEHYDNLAALFDCLKRINTILLDLSRDMWAYISMDYFKQQVKAGEVGSSAMPHKVNPIDFENAEGNLGLANAIFEHLSAKLPISRLQRDLTDSTVLRNIGVPIAHTLISLKSIDRGLNKLLLNEAKIHSDLHDNWAVAAEAIQTILRREGYPRPYEKLKELTRGAHITEQSIRQFIAALDVSDGIKDELNNISPFTYTGI
jgi:adenylosuccinate lyase